MMAAVIAQALGGRRVGDNWMACCPAHDDREPSLAIRDGDGTPLIYCHAGCEQNDVIAALRDRGLWEDADGRGRPGPNRPSRYDDGRRGADSEQRRGRALAIWTASMPAPDTIVGRYLSSRGLSLVLPERLRFHRGLKHPTGELFPAMVALVTDGVDDTPLGIHRTFLAHDGRGKAATAPARMMLGKCGGGAVRLGPVAEAVMVGEGIESCLAAMQATGRVAWAALSTSGLRRLALPDHIRRVVVLADGDDPGEAAAQNCARRWHREGRRVRIARPPRGADFNDLLLVSAGDHGGAS